MNGQMTEYGLVRSAKRIIGLKERFGVQSASAIYQQRHESKMKNARSESGEVDSGS